MRISDWSSDVCSSDLRKSGLTQRRIGPFGQKAFQYGPVHTDADEPTDALQGLFQRHHWPSGNDVLSGSGARPYLAIGRDKVEDRGLPRHLANSVQPFRIGTNENIAANAISRQ